LLGLTLACAQSADPARAASSRAVEDRPAAPVHEPLCLTSSRRQIYPPLVQTFRLAADGSVELVELVPPNREVVRVLRGRIDGARETCAGLGAAGFFEWLDADLVPPPEVDVDSDFYRVELRDGERERVLTTRDPHVPSSLRAVFDRLDRAVPELSPVGEGLVLVPELLRVPPGDLPLAAEASPWLPRLHESCSGPFPLALTERLSPEHVPPRSFLVRVGAHPYRVTCLAWP
jgi:hypothetical protein